MWPVSGPVSGEGAQSGHCGEKVVGGPAVRVEPLLGQVRDAEGNIRRE